MSTPRLEEPRTYSQVDMPEVEAHGFATGVACLFTARAPGKDTVNEDSLALIPFDATSGVLAVADGAGGMPAGEEASRVALGALVDKVRQATPEPPREGEPPSLRGAILDGIEAANQAVLDLGAGAATTLAVVEVQGTTVRSYHVGDSMILLTGQRGVIKLQTVAHSPVGYAVESGLLAEQEAVNHDDRHLVSNLIGTPEMRIEVGPTVELAARDTLVLASDAVPDNLLVNEIVERIRKGPLVKVTRKLAAACRGRMEHPAEGLPSHPDDTTVLLFRLLGKRLRRKGSAPQPR